MEHISFDKQKEIDVSNLTGGNSAPFKYNKNKICSIKIAIKYLCLFLNHSHNKVFHKTKQSKLII